MNKKIELEIRNKISVIFNMDIHFSLLVDHLFSLDETFSDHENDIPGVDPYTRREIPINSFPSTVPRSTIRIAQRARLFSNDESKQIK